MSPTLWFDVEDLFHYARHSARPSGIQRVTFEIYRAVQSRFGGTGRIRFVRHAPDGRDFVLVSWNELDSLFSRITDPAAAETARSKPFEAPQAAPAPARDVDAAESTLRHVMRRMADRLPPAMRQPLVSFLVLQAQSLTALAMLALGSVISAPLLVPFAARRFRRAFRSRMAAKLLESGAQRRPARFGAAFASLVRPGDALVVLGSPWFHEEYADLVADLRARSGVRFAILIHDIIPLRRPEWCHHGVVRSFRRWHAGVLPHCDVIFSNSRATASDLERHARGAGITLRRSVQPVRLGTSFGLAATPDGDRPKGAEPAHDPRLPPGSYVLFVSTIEARKNHMLLFRVWRRLLDEMPRERVPTLVFAGRVGWLVADLMQQLDNANYLDGKIVVVQEPSDMELRTLYRGCLFTVFPSLYEGWGLPVTESLALGRPCLSSDRTSLPEAGGSLARYFDPENLHDATAAIRAVIEDRAGLAAWTAEIARAFKHVAWDETAELIVATLRETGNGVSGKVRQAQDA